MIRLGKVYGNLMVDVKASNQKLEDRACRIVMAATGCTENVALTALKASQGQAKTAIVMVLLEVPAAAAASLLAKAGGYIDKVLPPDGKDGAHGL